jgi:large subunit ribosomal protein L10
MALTREKKEEILKDLKERCKTASSIAFVNFHGLDVGGANELRKKFKESGVDYLVAKKTLIRKAFGELGFEGEMPELEGEVALAFGKEDEVAPAKGLFEFSKVYSAGRGEKDTLKITGGILEGRYISMEEAAALARIPSREILYGKFVNIINSPVQGVVGTLQGVVRNFVFVLSELASKK